MTHSPPQLKVLAFDRSVNKLAFSHPIRRVAMYDSGMKSHDAMYDGGTKSHDTIIIHHNDSLGVIPVSDKKSVYE
jgi:hypothetical protein